MSATIILGDCLDVLRGMADASVDAVVTDPPYPEIDRPYGRMTEPDWHAMMRGVVGEVRRVLKPSGSAVFILQPNSERVGRMRPWLWEFMAWTAREWNQVQDAWWWNTSSPPTVHCQRKRGLMRPSVKACVWLGDPLCYRDQAAVMWTPSEAMSRVRVEDRVLQRPPSGQSVRRGRIAETVIDRGGVTPFNLLPISAGDSRTSGGAHGHGASTPMPLTAWWVRYLCPPGGTILDPFAGSGTTLVAALAEGRQAIGIEREAEYVEIIKQRIAKAVAA